MMIMHLDKKGMTNSDNCLRIILSGRYITAYMADGSNHSLGVFDNESDAKVAFENLFNTLEREGKV